MVQCEHHIVEMKVSKTLEISQENSFGNFHHLEGYSLLTGKEFCSFLWLSLPASGHAEPELLFCETVQLNRPSVLLGSGLQMHGYPEWKNKTKHNKTQHRFFISEKVKAPCFSHTEGLNSLKAIATNSCPSINLFLHSGNITL